MVDRSGQVPGNQTIKASLAPCLSVPFFTNPFVIFFINGPKGPSARARRKCPIGRLSFRISEILPTLKTTGNYQYVQYFMINLLLRVWCNGNLSFFFSNVVSMSVWCRLGGCVRQERKFEPLCSQAINTPQVLYLHHLLATTYQTDKPTKGLFKGGFDL